jgi:hypothetical protein
LFWLSDSDDNAFRVTYGAGVDHTALLTGKDEASVGVSVAWYMGASAPEDVIWSGWGGLALVSGRLKSALEHARLTGWSTYQVDLVGKFGETIEDYYGFVVLGRCGEWDLGRSVRVMKQYRTGPHPVWVGSYFEESSWDGSDFVVPDGSASIVATAAVVELCREMRVTGLSFVSLNAAEEILTGDRLRRWEERNPGQ